MEEPGPFGFALQVVGQVARQAQYALVHGGAEPTQPTLFFGVPNPAYVKSQAAAAAAANLAAASSAASEPTAPIPPLWNRDP